MSQPGNPDPQERDILDSALTLLRNSDRDLRDGWLYELLEHLYLNVKIQNS